MIRARTLSLLLAALGFVLALGWRHAEMKEAGATDGLTVTVTSAGDGAGICPGPACTLRHAIELVNADGAGTEAYAIRFDPGVFPADVPATIRAVGSGLPIITRPAVRIDGGGAGVRLDGSFLPANGQFSGLVLEGAGSSVKSLAVHRFTAACIVLRGDGTLAGGSRAAGEGNVVGGCETGILVTGRSAIALGNIVGFTADASEPSPMSAGIEVRAADASIGRAGALGNVIGNAPAGVVVGGTPGPAFEGVSIAANIIGKDLDGHPAPVSVGVSLRHNSGGSTVEGNTIAYASAGIQVASNAGGPPVMRNRLTRNRFEGLSGLAIDLNADIVRNPNDAGDADTGANGLRNYPTITRAVQSRISGVAGAFCAGCTVELYTAVHTPGGGDDYGGEPVATGVATVDPQGNFAFESPPVTPGQWVAALVTDADSNTSEFGPSTRVGAGVVQCGNVTLQPGWNHVAFFGPNPLTLGAAFPPDSGSVDAIYRLDDGAGTYGRWLAGTTTGRTLDGLVPGEVYWFHSETSVAVQGGFSLTVPLPVPLKKGWNDFVYIGAPGDIADAFGSIAGKYTEAYRYEVSPSESRWRWSGRSDTPAWAREFTEVQACATYQVAVTEDVTLVPLQP